LDAPEGVAPEIPANDISAEQVVESARIGAALEKVIAALPKKLREPLILLTIGEMSPREVGAVLGLNEAAVRSRVFRARQILREKLAVQLGRK
jgi:RNA polymerase sigma-70 factor (ECF subfamily)